GVVLLISLEYRGSVYSGGRAERIFSYYRIIRRYRYARCPRDRLTIFLQFPEILVFPWRNLHELEIHQHLIHLRIANALANSQRTCVYALRSSNQRGHCIGDRHTPVKVTVPIIADLLTSG